MNYTHTYS